MRLRFWRRDARRGEDLMEKIHSSSTLVSEQQDLWKSVFHCLCSSTVIQDSRMIRCSGVDFCDIFDGSFFFRSDLDVLGGFQFVIFLMGGGVSLWN